MLRLLLLDAALHAAEGPVHALQEAVLGLLVVLLHLQGSVSISKHGLSQSPAGRRQRPGRRHVHSCVLFF